MDANGTIDFLQLVLPEIERMRLDVKKLDESDQDDPEIVRSLLKRLCRSTEMFPRVSLPQLLAEPHPMPEHSHDDTAWITGVAFNLNDFLVKNKLEWPPPTRKGQDPSILKDLIALYQTCAWQGESASERELLAAVAPVGEKSCRLSNRWKTSPPSPMEVAKVKADLKLYQRWFTVMTVIATCSGVIGTAATINEAGPASRELMSNVRELGSVVATELKDVSRNLDMQLQFTINIAFPPLEPPEPGLGMW